VCQSGTERKREENQRRHPRPRPEAVLSHEPAYERDAAHGQPDLADHRPGLRAADRLERGHSVVAESADTRQLREHPGAEEHAGD
ncbi:nuclease, partial [Enterobacter hormaechei]|nr:nuclease [Enterobacter hormaechei]